MPRIPQARSGQFSDSDLSDDSGFSDGLSGDVPEEKEDDEYLLDDHGRKDRSKKARKDAKVKPLYVRFSIAGATKGLDCTGCRNSTVRMGFEKQVVLVSKAIKSDIRPHVLRNGGRRAFEVRGAIRRGREYAPAAQYCNMGS